MQDSTTKKPFRHPIQSFVWLRDSWDIAKLIGDIDAGTLKPKKIVLDREFIEAYAEQGLALRKGVALDKQAKSFFVSVNCTEAVNLPDEALQEPVIFLELTKDRGVITLEGSQTRNHILGDGQHRMAKAYFSDAPQMEAYVLTRAQTKKYQEK